MNKSVYCIASYKAQADSMLNQLRRAGFSSDDISVLYSDTGGSHDFAIEHNTKAPEGVTAGGVAGMGAGAILGWLAGVGTLAIPGVGPFIAAGPIMAALGGAAIGGAAGGITGALVGVGIPEYEAKRYEGKVKAGNILISVHAVDSRDIDRATNIFKRGAAQDIAASSEATV